MQLQRLVYCLPLGAIGLLLGMTQPWKTLNQVQQQQQAIVMLNNRFSGRNCQN